VAQFSDTGDRLATDVEAKRPLSLWQNRDYMLLWAGQAVSSFGSQITQLTFPLLVLALTGSPAQAGFVGALRALPFAILSLPAGALVDRWNRKRLMIWCDIGRALALGSVPLALALGRLGLPQLAIVSIIEGTLFLFFNLAESSSLPQIVPREQLPGALTQNQVTDSLSQLLGPTLGGALYAFGAAVPFVADAVSYTLSLLTLCFIRTPLQEERTAPPGRLRDEIVEGIAWLWRQSTLRFVALLTGGLMVCSVGYPLIMIVLGERIGASSFEIGLIFAGGGAGSIIGGLLTPWLQRRFRFGPLFIWSAWIWAITWLFFLFAPNVLTLGLVHHRADLHDHTIPLPARRDPRSAPRADERPLPADCLGESAAGRGAGRFAPGTDRAGTDDHLALRPATAPGDHGDRQRGVAARGLGELTQSVGLPPRH